jgi:hypothetical protein
MSEANERVTSESDASLCSAVGGDTAAVEADVQRMAGMLAELYAIATHWEDVALGELEGCRRPRGTPEYGIRLTRWARLQDLRVALSIASDASRKAQRAVMDGKLDAIR